MPSIMFGTKSHFLIFSHNSDITKVHIPDFKLKLFAYM